MASKADAADGSDHVEPVNRAAWRAWLLANHATAARAWLVRLRKHAGGPNVSYHDAVEEAICFGWVDSVPRKLDADRSLLLFTPGKPGSGWSRPNKGRVARMEAAGVMAPAGRAAVEAARADGSWSMLDAVESLVVPDDLSAAFDERPGSRGNWEAFPRSAKRGILEWITKAKRPETRRKRIIETADKAAENGRANQWRRRQ